MENIKRESKNLETSPIYSWNVSLAGGKSPYERRGDRTFDLIRNQYTDDPDYPKKIIWKPIIKKIKQK